MTDDIYFGTLDGDLVTNFELARIAKIVDGREIDYNDLLSIKAYADICRGIVGEVENPSVKFLIRHGHKVKAVQIYHRQNPEVSLTECKKIVDDMADELISERN